MKSVSQIPRPGISDILSPLSLGYQQLLPMEEFKEGQQPPDFAQTMNELAQRESEDESQPLLADEEVKQQIISDKVDELNEVQEQYLRRIPSRRRPNIFGQSRATQPQPQPSFDDDPGIFTSVNDVQQVDVIAEPNQLPVAAVEFLNQQQLPPQLDANQVLPEDERDRDNLTLYQRFLHAMLTVLSIDWAQHKTAKQIYDLFRQYRDYTNNLKRTADLPNLREKTKDMTESELRQYIGESDLPNECKWVLNVDERGVTHYTVSCTYDKPKKKLNYFIR